MEKMNAELVDRLNELVKRQKSNANPQTLHEIQVLLKTLEYQSWILKYNLRMIENPEEDLKISELNNYVKLFSYRNAFSKNDLIVPLMLHLFTNNQKNRSALESSLELMKSSKQFLREGDFAKTKTGVQRFITNTRFASFTLRNFGLLRSDEKHFFHNWKLSLFGILIAGSIYHDHQFKIVDYFLGDEYAKKDRYLIFRGLLSYHLDILQNENRFNLIMQSIFDDEIVSNYMGIYEREFLQFAKTVRLVLENGYNAKNDSTRKLISLLNGINSDREISRLADSIILKKNIDTNMDFIFDLIKKNSESKSSEEWEDLFN